MSFALRLGFDAIFAAIGFSCVAVDPATVLVDVDPGADGDVEPDVVTELAVVVGLPEVDLVGLPLVVGLPVLCVVVATGLPLVVGFPVVRVVVDVTGLPLVVGFPVWRVVVALGLPLVVGLPVLRVVVDTTGLPLVAGLPDAGGLPDFAPCP